MACRYTVARPLDQGRLRNQIQEITSRPLRELLPTEDYGGLGAMPNRVALARNHLEEKLNRM